MLDQVKAELQDLNDDGLTIGDETFPVDLILVSDWKFTALILGLVAASGSYFCIRCNCEASERRSREKNRSCRGDDEDLPGRIREPILIFSFNKMLIDLLHLFLRVTEPLLKCLIEQAIIHQSSSCLCAHLTVPTKTCSCACHINSLWELTKEAEKLGVHLDFWMKSNHSGPDDHDEHEGGSLRWISLQGPDKKKVAR